MDMPSSVPPTSLNKAKLPSLLQDILMLMYKVKNLLAPNVTYFTSNLRTMIFVLAISLYLDLIL